MAQKSRITIRRFIVNKGLWHDQGEGYKLDFKGYICRDPDRTVIVKANGGVVYGNMSVKLHTKILFIGKDEGGTQPNVEVRAMGNEENAHIKSEMLLGMCDGFIIERHNYPYRRLDNEGGYWDIDVFQGPLKGLIIAEIELRSAREQFRCPPFIGREITDDPRFFDQNLNSEVAQDLLAFCNHRDNLVQEHPVKNGPEPDAQKVSRPRQEWTH